MSNLALPYRSRRQVGFTSWLLCTVWTFLEINSLCARPWWLKGQLSTLLDCPDTIQITKSLAEREFKGQQAADILQKLWLSSRHGDKSRASELKGHLRCWVIAIRIHRGLNIACNTSHGLAEVVIEIGHPASSLLHEIHCSPFPHPLLLCRSSLLLLPSFLSANPSSFTAKFESLENSFHLCSVSCDNSSHLNQTAARIITAQQVCCN